jgi:hypothetical protein
MISPLIRLPISGFETGVFDGYNWFMKNLNVEKIILGLVMLAAACAAVWVNLP